MMEIDPSNDLAVFLPASSELLKEAAVIVLIGSIMNIRMKQKGEAAAQ